MYTIYRTQIHANKYIEQHSNKPPTTSITNGHNRVIEKARTRTFHFKNVRLTDLVGL